MPARIVVLDGYTLNPGDLSWKELEILGDTTIYDRTSPELVMKRCEGAEILLTNKVELSANEIPNLVSLGYIGVLATGYNIVDILSAKASGVIVTNIPAYGTHSVAQHTFGLILELSNLIGKHTEHVRTGGWQQDFSYTLEPTMELSGKNLGILGWGKIGQQVAEIGRAFGMQILVHSKFPESGKAVFVDMETLFKRSDVLTIHTAFTENKAGLVNMDLLKLMKPESVLINTSRGQVVNEPDLKKALNNGILKGAALDVLSEEPPSSNHPLLDVNNCIITPHMAWSTFEARKRLLETAIDNVKNYIYGRPENVVNP